MHTHTRTHTGGPPLHCLTALRISNRTQAVHDFGLFYGRRTVFSPQQSSNCENVFGNQQQRQMSMPNRGNIEGPLFMEDLSGDGKITQKDVGIGQGWIKPDKK